MGMIRNKMEPDQTPKNPQTLKTNPNIQPSRRSNHKYSQRDPSTFLEAPPPQSDAENI